MRYADALAMADHTITYRLIVKEVAAWHGVLRDLHAEAALRRERLRHAHPHVALQERAEPVLRREGPSTTCRRRPRRSSPACSCMRARCRRCSRSGSTPTSGSSPGTRRRSTSRWSQRNRSALIRIPLYKPGAEQATRAEIRCPDPACNPYLAFAALLQAGLEGIEKGYELPDEMTTNLYRLSEAEREERGIVALPGLARGGDRGDGRAPS